MLSFVVQVIATMLKFVIAYTLIFPSLTIVALFNEICRIFVSLSLLWTKYRLFGFGLSNMFYLAGPFHGGLNLCVLVSQDEVDIEKERSRFQRVLRFGKHKKTHFLIICGSCFMVKTCT